MDYENKTINWKPLSEYKGGRVLATNDLDILIGEINSDGDCADGDGCRLCGITAFADIEDITPKPKESEDERIKKELVDYLTNELEGKSQLTPYTHQFKAWIAWLERQSEQKLTDKVELKFKVGDYVVGKYISGYISEVRDDCYLLDYQGFSIDKQDNYHLWTIQDAQDGDVLAFNDGHGNDCIELIKSITGKKIEFWFCLTNGNRYEVFDGITPYTNLASREDATPATKEQRDLLFKKMKEAGYKWDTEKKELKEIHVIDEGKDEMDYCFTKMMNGEKVTPAWSKKDEKMLKETLALIETVEDINKVKDGFLDVKMWLKSLKDKIHLEAER